MPTDLHDQTGEAIAFIDDDNTVHIYRSGYVVAWLWGRHIFTFHGEHIGWFDDGWVRDHDGNAVAFSADASAPPKRMPMSPPELRKAKSKAPAKPSSRGELPQAPAFSGNWGLVSGNAFFGCIVDEYGAPHGPGQPLRRWARMRDRLLEQQAAPVADERSNTPAERGALLVGLNEALAALRARPGDEAARAAFADAGAAYAMGTDLPIE